MLNLLMEMIVRLTDGPRYRKVLKYAGFARLRKGLAIWVDDRDPMKRHPADSLGVDANKLHAGRSFLALTPAAYAKQRR
jgi:iron uptake system EfeUOB component EfeO/EfeM